MPMPDARALLLTAPTRPAMCTLFRLRGAPSPLPKPIRRAPSPTSCAAPLSRPAHCMPALLHRLDRRDGAFWFVIGCVMVTNMFPVCGIAVLPQPAEYPSPISPLSIIRYAGIYHFGTYTWPPGGLGPNSCNDTDPRPRYCSLQETPQSPDHLLPECYSSQRITIYPSPLPA
ncbi:hypothetical protein DFH06DRAFT_154889 [Mycena polygramma]|nr:hypothetical protein DFH06DRAFT_154889 [Mycena polygramma]